MRRALALAALVCACSHDHGPPHIRAIAKPDGVPTVRSVAGIADDAPRAPRIASYTIAATLDAERHMISAQETLTWTNPGQSPVESLPFHLYLNGFKNEDALFMRTSHGELRGAKFGAWGWIDIHSLTIDGVELAKTLTYPGAPDQTVAELKLPHPIGPGETVVIKIAFEDQLPEVFARTGYKGEFHMVGQWFPKIGVRVGAPGSERWECQPFHAHNEFFADFGSYDVTLTVPATHVVAATGVLESAVEAPGGQRTFRYRADDVHDFAWMADPYMNVLTGQAKLPDGPPVEVRVYYRGEQKDFSYRHLEAAIGTIEKMSAWFYPYPWPIMTVIDPPSDAMFSAGGMEYPTLVTTAGDSAVMRPGIRLPESVTVHEVGHNWFQGLLASNEPVEAWLDEGVNEWADGKVMDELYGPRGSMLDWNGWQASMFALRRAIAEDPADVPAPIASAAFAFPDFAAYTEATYNSTLRALRTLELTVGSTKFMAAMKAYAHAFAFKHPTGRDLFDTLSHELGMDLTWFFGPVFHDVGGLKLKVRSDRCDPHHAKPRGVIGDGSDRKIVDETDGPDTGSYDCEVIVQNTGTIHVPVDVLLKFADGSEQRMVWDDHGEAWTRLTLERGSKIAEIVLDPDHKLQLDQPTDHDLRTDGDASASVRAAAWVGAVTQTLMQLVGP